jgi:hypothetical protein
VEKTRGIAPEELANKPVFSANIQMMMELYVDIQRGCSTIGYEELDCYQRVVGVKLKQWEVSLMISIDIIRNKNA